MYAPRCLTHLERRRGERGKEGRKGNVSVTNGLTFFKENRKGKKGTGAIDQRSPPFLGGGERKKKEGRIRRSSTSLPRGKRGEGGGREDAAHFSLQEGRGRNLLPFKSLLKGEEEEGKKKS